MVRARTAVDRAVQEGLIGAARPLLIIGAGAAGATAAIRSAALGVRTLLIEAAPAPFLRQAGCTTRWVDPVQYDWPVHHWRRGSYPWTPPAMPLPWSAGPANQIALAWAVALNRARRRLPGLDVMYQTVLVGLPAPVKGSLARVSLTSVRRAFPLRVRRVGMVLSCAGAGTEKSSHGNYSGFDFWSADPFQQMATSHRVLISGGGDGALQDYLRVVTKLGSAKAIYARLKIPAGIEHYLQSAEDQAARVYIWGANGLHDHAALQRLHETHLDIVDHLLSRPLTGLLHTLDDLTKKLPEITLMFPCTHISRCYGLNRFSSCSWRLTSSAIAPSAP